jgi:signal peptidase I
VQNYRSEMNPEPPVANSGGPGIFRTLIDILETVVLSVVLFVVINLVSSRIRVESISMQPTLYAGNFVLVNKLGYKIGQPTRGDIIVFKYPPDPSQTPYIKRVIGLPGDTINVENGKVYVNGQELIEPYLMSNTARGGTWTVPEGDLFVMGDNRNNSSDSRSWGFVPLGNVIGKAEIIYWPPEKWAMLNTTIAAAGTTP